MHPLLRASAERQCGLFTADDARRAGYDPNEVRALCRSGRWIRLRRGVYCTAGTRSAMSSPRVAHRAACLAVLLTLDRPSTVVSHTSAARLWGLPVRRGLGTTVRLTDPFQWRRGPDYRIAQAPLLPSDAARLDRVPLTSVARTLIDCAREWDLEDAVVAADFALLAERVTPEQLAAACEAASTWPGAARAGRVVALADGRAESALESRGRLRMVGSGLPRPELQVEIRTSAGLIAVADAWFEEAAVAVEFDGRVKYTDPWRGRSPEQVLWEEKRREDAMRALDIRVVRVVDADLDRWAPVELRLRELTTTPGPALRRFTATPRVRGVRRSA